jgi:hypothetical protein
LESGFEEVGVMSEADERLLEQFRQLRFRQPGAVPPESGLVTVERPGAADEAHIRRMLKLPPKSQKPRKGKTSD